MINQETFQKEKSTLYDEKKKLIEKYREIPPNFLDEKSRVAINKLINGAKRTNSDNYYLRKLKSTLKKKLKEAEFYDTLDKLLKKL
jgi:hypothetical protein